MATEVFESREVYVGRDFGGTDYEISADAVENYIAATGDDHPWYRGVSPLGYAVAPALVVHSAVFRTFDWYLPNVFGNLHARQEWEVFSPICVGEIGCVFAVAGGRALRQARSRIRGQRSAADERRRTRRVQRSRTRTRRVSSMATGGGEKRSPCVDRDREKSSARVASRSA